MLNTLGVQTIDQLMDQTVPENIRLNKQEMFVAGSNKLDAVDSGNIIIRHMTKLAAANKIYKSY